MAWCQLIVVVTMGLTSVALTLMELTHLCISHSNTNVFQERKYLILKSSQSYH